MENKPNSNSVAKITNQPKVLIYIGNPEGNPLLSLIAEEFMKSFESKIEHEQWFPRMWWKYVDDVIAIVNKTDIHY